MFVVFGDVNPDITLQNAVDIGLKLKLEADRRTPRESFEFDFMTDTAGAGICHKGDSNREKDCEGIHGSMKEAMG